MKLLTKDLIGPALDWAVAKCEYDELAALNIQYPEHAKHYPAISPSTEWSWGGPIIERESIDLHYLGGGWEASIYSGKWHSSEFSMLGLTALIAAMRCYVASKLGEEVEEVEIPDELCGVQDDTQALVDYVDGR